MNARILLAVAVTTAASAVSGADRSTYSITAHIIANGTSAHATSSCFGLEATIAESVAGFSAGGEYALSAGFRHMIPRVNDTIFGNAFEDCSQ